ncbi:hypothetical protein NL676_013831 [Syzygium grande]|nr:hypothetical protein NL676_013831 [Syzygium grande]
MKPSKRANIHQFGQQRRRKSLRYRPWFAPQPTPYFFARFFRVPPSLPLLCTVPESSPRKNKRGTTRKISGPSRPILPNLSFPSPRPPLSRSPSPNHILQPPVSRCHVSPATGASPSPPQKQYKREQPSPAASVSFRFPLLSDFHPRVEEADESGVRCSLRARRSRVGFARARPRPGAERLEPGSEFDAVGQRQRPVRGLLQPGPDNGHRGRRHRLRLLHDGLLLHLHPPLRRGVVRRRRGSRRAVRLVPAAGGGGNERCLRRGLDPGVVDSFPVLAYVAVRDHKLGKGALECAVCLTEFDDFDRLKILPKCEHVFHPECIDAWLAFHVTCPVCRANQTPDPCLRLVVAAAAAAEWAADQAPISQRRAEEEEEEEHQPRRQQQQPPPCDEVRNDVRIDIGGGGGGDEEVLGAAAAAAAASSRAPAVKLPKSHSTGHLRARPGADPDRYALRLPEEVRQQIRTAAGMRRSTSYDVLVAAIEGSSRKGGRLLAGTPSFLPKADKIHHHARDGMDGGDRELEVGVRSLSRLPV